jgi:cilia- and flagella-associated protein 57
VGTDKHIYQTGDSKLSANAKYILS